MNLILFASKKSLTDRRLDNRSSFNFRKKENLSSIPSTPIALMLPSCCAVCDDRSGVDMMRSQGYQEISPNLSAPILRLICFGRRFLREFFSQPSLSNSASHLATCHRAICNLLQISALYQMASFVFYLGVGKRDKHYVKRVIG